MGKHIETGKKNGHHVVAGIYDYFMKIDVFRLIFHVILFQWWTSSDPDKDCGAEQATGHYNVPY